jgi:hypothetical protein
VSLKAGLTSMEKRKYYLLSLPGIEHIFLGRPVRRLVTIPTELSGLVKCSILMPHSNKLST